MSEVTPKQYRVAVLHLKQAQESLRLARHTLGGPEAEDFYDYACDGEARSTEETIATLIVEAIALDEHCARKGVE